MAVMVSARSHDAPGWNCVVDIDGWCRWYVGDEEVGLLSDKVNWARKLPWNVMEQVAPGLQGHTW